MAFSARVLRLSGSALLEIAIPYGFHRSCRNLRNQAESCVGLKLLGCRKTRFRVFSGHRVREKLPAFFIPPNVNMRSFCVIPMNQDIALSPKEVAAQLRLSTRTVLQRIRDGQLGPVHRINQRVIRIPQSSVNDYLRQAGRN